MNDFIPSLVQVSTPFIFILLMAALSIAVAWWLYKTTRDELSSLAFFTLFLLRSSVLFLIFFLFFNPVITTIFDKAKNKKIIVLADLSASTSREGKLENMRDVLFRTINKFSDNSRLVVKGFNNGIVNGLADSLPVPFGQTDFKQALDYFKSESPDLAILVSDGNHTGGYFPVSEFNNLPFPIHTIGIGKIRLERDLLIEDVRYPAVAYKNREQKIEVVVKNQQYISDSSAIVSLFRNKKLLERQSVKFDKMNSYQNIVFNTVATRNGMDRMEVRLSNLDQDENSENNTFVFAQKILNSRVKVGLFTSSPGYESKFINLLLSRSRDFDIQYFAEDRDGKFIGKQGSLNLDKLDVILMEGYPSRKSNQEIARKLIAMVGAGKSAAIVFINKKSDLPLLNQLLKQMNKQFSVVKEAARKGGVNKTDNRNYAHLVHLFGSQERNDEFWTSLPPLEIAHRLEAPNAAVLLNSSEPKETALFVLAHTKNKKMALLNGSGFWRWHFVLQSNRDINRGYEHFLRQLVRWAAQKGKLDPLVLNFKKDVIYLGEQAVLMAQMYDANYQQIKEGSVSLEVKGAGQSFTIPMSVDSSGNYQASFMPSAEGRYTVLAEGREKGQLIADNKIPLEVIPISREFLRAGQDRKYLKEIADRSNGVYTTHQDTDSLLNSINFSPTVVKITNKYEIRHYALILFLIIIIISLEWVLRKKFGLA